MPGLRVQVRYEVGPMMAKLEAVKRGVRNRILRKALRAGSRVVVVAVRALVPVRRKVKGANISPQKLLKKSIGVKMMTYRSGVVVGVVGARSKKTRIGVRVRGRHAGQAVYENPANIAHMVERGHAVGIRKGAGILGAVARAARRLARRLVGGGGTVPPHPFLDPALKSSKAGAESAIRGVLEEGLKEVAGD